MSLLNTPVIFPHVLFRYVQYSCGFQSPSQPTGLIHPSNYLQVVVHESAGLQNVSYVYRSIIFTAQRDTQDKGGYCYLTNLSFVILLFFSPCCLNRHAPLIGTPGLENKWISLWFDSCQTPNTSMNN